MGASDLGRFAWIVLPQRTLPLPHRSIGFPWCRLCPRLPISAIARSSRIPIVRRISLDLGRSATIKNRVAAASGSRLPRAAAAALCFVSTSSILVYSIIRIRLWSAILLVLGTRGLMRRLLVPSFRVDFGFVEASHLQHPVQRRSSALSKQPTCFWTSTLRIRSVREQVRQEPESSPSRRSGRANLVLLQSRLFGGGTLERK